MDKSWTRELFTLLETVDNIELFSRVSILDPLAQTMSTHGLRDTRSSVSDEGILDILGIDYECLIDGNAVQVEDDEISQELELELDGTRTEKDDHDETILEKIDLSEIYENERKGKFNCVAETQGIDIQSEQSTGDTETRSLEPRDLEDAEIEKPVGPGYHILNDIKEKDASRLTQSLGNLFFN